MKSSMFLFLILSALVLLAVPSEPGSCSYLLMTNIDHNSNLHHRPEDAKDVTVKTPSWDECCKACNKEKLCTAWSLDWKKSPSTCYLKFGPVTGFKPSDDHVTGLRFKTAPRCSIHSHTVFPRATFITSLNVTFKYDCCEACLKEPKCTVWTMENNVCSLKKLKASKSGPETVDKFINRVVHGVYKANVDSGLVSKDGICCPATSKYSYTHISDSYLCQCRGAAVAYGEKPITCQSQKRCSVMDPEVHRVDYYIWRGAAAGCFPTKATVQTPGGPKSMADLQIGDSVLTAPLGGQARKPVFSKVYAWLQHSDNVATTFLKISTASGPQLFLTPHHIIFSKQFNKGVPARDIKPGDMVWITDSNNELVLSNVTSVRMSEEKGSHSPATIEGTILDFAVWATAGHDIKKGEKLVFVSVDGVLASNYALDSNSVSHSLIHTTFAPLRWGHSLSEFIWGTDLNNKFPLWHPDHENKLWYADILKKLYTHLMSGWF